MQLFYQHEATAKSRALYLANRNHTTDGVRPEIAESWNRTLEKGLDPASPCVRIPGGGNVITDPQLINKMLPEEHKFSRQEFVGEIFDNLMEYLESIGSAYFAAHNDLTIFMQRGNAQILRACNARNIGIGASLAEEYTGTTAAVLSKRGRRESWVIGAEHYLEFMQDYATYAFGGEDYYSEYFTVVITPREVMTESFVMLMRYFHMARLAIGNSYRTSLELSMKSELFDQFLETRDHAIIFVDFYKKIINVNRVFTSWFNIPADDVLNCFFEEVLPELKSALTCLKTGRSMTYKEVYFEELPSHLRHMRMACTPWKRHDIVSGMIVQLSDAKHLRTIGNTVGNANARYTFDDLIGRSESFLTIKNMARIAAQSNSTVIISGASGTGKELFAHAIHNASKRKNKPFVAVNCSAIPRELIGSELFGYVDGAFTGARKGGALGKFEFAQGGTLFLDEIGELPFDVQGVLLRVLEERTIMRIGSNNATSVDVRVISATNRDLLHLVAEGKFRLDLYYRLNVLSITLPPLRDRPEDLALLVDHYMDSLSLVLHKNIHAISSDALAVLLDYSWPGNIRQLRNVLERAINMASTGTLTVSDLPQEVFTSHHQHDQSAVPPKPGSGQARLPDPRPDPDENDQKPYFDGSFEDWDRASLWELMQKHRGNKSRIAKELGLSRGTVYRKIVKYGFE